MAITVNDFHNALMDRIGTVKDMGTAATQDAVNLAKQQQMINALNAQNKINSATGPSSIGSPTGKTSSGTPLYYGSNGTGKNTFGNFIKAISGRESGGNYSAVNRDSGALGKYQIMPGNIPQWSQQALGHKVSTSTFLHSPQIQEKVAQFKLNYYYSKYGPAGAAVAWYAGEGNAKKWLKANGQGNTWNRPQGAYSSISAYAYGILKAMGLR